MFHLKRTVQYLLAERTRIHEPEALTKNQPLSNSQGSVLDPIVAIRYRFVIDAHDSVTIDMVLGIGENKECLHGAGRKIPGQTINGPCF